MNKKQNAREVEINRLAKNLAKLVMIFRQGGQATDSKWWHSQSSRSLFYPDFGYQDGQPIFEEVVQGILRLNPEMLSKQKIESSIMFNFLPAQTISLTQPNHLNNQALIDEAKNHIRELIEFKAWQNIDIPIGNLWLGGKPVEIGKVIFMSVTQEELEQWKKKYFWSEGAPDVGVVARVKAPGDLENALSYARNHVDLTLNVLRAFCFPFGRESDMWRVGVVGDIISAASTPVRINNRHFAAQLGPGVAWNELRKHILSKLDQPQWKLIDKLIQKTHPSKMERKLLDGIHWLGEATKPDTNRAKFAKISIALEALLGGEPKDNKYLQIRGITATLAERAAFIAGTNHDDMLAIDKNVQKHSRRRGGVMHGDAEDVPLNEIDGFGELVRRIALALLEKLDELGDKMKEVTKLEEWARSQRYTLPREDK